MGMYTEFHFNSRLKQGTPDSIIKILKYLNDHSIIIELPNHEFFNSYRWMWLFQSDSYYFDGDTYCTIRYDKIAKAYFLNIKTNIKNYEQEITKFIDFIYPYLDKIEGEFLGFYRYEETEDPTLIHYEERR
jgi:hypothetical protein